MDAFTMGKMAFWNGIAIEDCPFEIDWQDTSGNMADWLAGWQSGCDFLENKIVDSIVGVDKL